MNEAQKKHGMNLLVIITSLSDGDRADGLLQKANLPLRFRCHGVGTASSEILDVLGLGSSDKAITISLIPKFAAPQLLQAVSNGLDLHKPGRGIAFSVPISGASGRAMQFIDMQTLKNIEDHIESEVKKMAENVTHGLLLVTVNQGCCEEVMEAAKQGGAFGGTVIHGRRLGMEDALKFWGISMQEEKDIVAILVSRENRLPVMKLIEEKCGRHSEAQGLVVSLPVDGVAGMD